MRAALLQRCGYWCWTDCSPLVEIRFYGKGPDPAAAPDDLLSRCEEAPRPPAAWLDQRHSAVTLEARPGACGEGDALVTGSRGLALSLFTADCVPILLAGPGVAAAIHAGWRGIARGVVAAALAATRVRPPTLTAWLGPAIGACCYEVGAEVAAEVAAASDSGVVRRRRGRRPHLDLHRAVRSQLEAAGVRRIRSVGRCTRCSPEMLWSYRRDARESGRNLSLIWLRAVGEG